MKKISIFIMIVLISCFSFVSNGKMTRAEYFHQDLLSLIHVASSSEAKIVEWSLYAREKKTLDKGETEQLIHTLHHDFPHMEWSHIQSNQKNELYGEQKENGVVEKIKFVSTLTKGQTTSYLFYEVHANEYHSSQQRFLERSYPTKIEKIFDKKPQVFSCIKGTFSGNTDEVLIGKAAQMLDKLHATKRESVTEERFLSISAYTTEMQSYVPLGNGKMNVQLSLRKKALGEETTFVLGTPIITIEY
jgi:hypothetical protein